MLGLPVGVTLALKTNLGTIGLWTGLAGSNIIQVCPYIVLIVKIFLMTLCAYRNMHLLMTCVFIGCGISCGISED